jgi:acetyl esterase/lipase
MAINSLIKPLALVALLLAISFAGKAQLTQQEEDSIQQRYSAELRVTGKTFVAYFRPHYKQIYSLPERGFLSKIDSARDAFFRVLKGYMHRLDFDFAQEQNLEINYYFDKMLAEYPYNHEVFTGEVAPAKSKLTERLSKNLPDFNKPDYLQKSDFTDYARAYFSYLIYEELKDPSYKDVDNRNLKAIWHLLPLYVTDRACLEFWQYDYLSYHIDNFGIKNIDEIYRAFTATSGDTADLRKIKELYTSDSIGRTDHLITTYKKAGPFALDMHIFLPDGMAEGKKRPAIVFLHGGSWSEGKPDWFFWSCQGYAKKGWVACAVEYRIYGREGTLPFDAVKDARSAIRWLRMHADEYGIDTNRIVVSGNSAGGHLALTCAMADKWNEATDDLHYSPVPNLIMVNSGVYDLTDQSTAWIRKDLQDKDLVKTISPNFLVHKGLPPILAIHGTSDGNVPFASAEKFKDEMLKAGNSIEFHPITNATHFIWYDPRWLDEVSNTRIAFLQKSGY